MTCFERRGSSLFAETWQSQNLKPFGHFFFNSEKKLKKNGDQIVKIKITFSFNFIKNIGC